MGKIGLLKEIIEQKKFKCNTETNRFYSYGVLLVIILLTGDFSKFNWYFLFMIVLLIIIVLTLIKVIKLRNEINKDYKRLFKLLKESV